MHFVAAVDDVPEMRGVLCLFEGVATGAADGYARMSGGPAATLLHLGPGRRPVDRCRGRCRAGGRLAGSPPSSFRRTCPGATAPGPDALAAADRIVAAAGAGALAETFPARITRGAGVAAIERLGYGTDQASGQLANARHVTLVDAAEPVSFFAHPGRPGRPPLPDATCERWPGRVTPLPTPCASSPTESPRGGATAPPARAATGA